MSKNREDRRGAGTRMRCQYCRQLIIHKFNGNYNRVDRKRKARHERRCPERPTEKTDKEAYDE